MFLLQSSPTKVPKANPLSCFNPVWEGRGKFLDGDQLDPRSAEAGATPAFHQGDVLHRFSLQESGNLKDHSISFI